MQDSWTSATHLCTYVDKNAFLSLGPWLILKLLCCCTYSSFPTKDVSHHVISQVRTAEEILTKDIFGRWSSKGWEQLGAVTGVKTWSELTDVRSVLRSNDVQEESEEEEGLVPTFSSRHPSPGSMLQSKDKNVQKGMQMNEGVLDEDGWGDECIQWCLDKAHT